MYAIVKTGGKQYRVEQGQSLLVERLPALEGDSVALDPLLYVDGSNVVDQVDGLSGVRVEARVVAHERGPKLRVVKFKPKRGYKRRNGHRQDLTRIEVVGIKLAGGRSRSRATKAESGDAAEAASPTPVAAAPAAAPEAPAPAAAPAEKAAEKAPARRPKRPAAEKPDAPATAKPKASAAAKPKTSAADKPKTPRTRAPKKTAPPEDAGASPETTPAPEEASDGT